MYNAKAYSVSSATSPFASTTIARRDPYERLARSDVKYRFSIDMASLKSE